MARVNEFSPRIQMTASGLSDYMRCLQKITEIQKETLLEMVDSKAEIIEEKHRETASTMLQGKYYKGAVAASVKRSKARMNKRQGPNSIIRFKGEQHGNRLAEIAFVNEYGKKNQPARRFIKMALETGAEPGTKAAARVLFDWQKKQGL